MKEPAPHPALRLRARDLAVARGAHTVVSGLDLDVGPGLGLVLRGPNGAGKSTVLMALAGLLPTQAGTLEWQGHDPEIGIAPQIHYLGHLSGLKPALTVRENLAFWCDLLSGDRTHLDDQLAQAGLAGLGNIEAGLLSAGQSRRLALARLLLAPRPVWLLDEPTSALDAQGSSWLEDLVRAHLARGGLAVVATHLALALEADENLLALELAGRA